MSRGEQGACKRSFPCCYLHTYRQALERARRVICSSQSIMNINCYRVLAACLFLPPSSGLWLEEVLIMAALAG